MTAERFPFVAVVIFMFALGMCRGQATYWLARVVTEQALRRTHPVQGWRLRMHRWLSDGAADRGRAILNRWGLPAVTLCYLTVGVQTIVLASAGVTRIPWSRFTLAQAPGALAWAVIYSTIGFAVWAAAWQAALSRHPIIATAIVSAVIVAVVILWRSRRRLRDLVG